MLHTMAALKSRLEQLRADTPGVQHVTHFNNAGCALPPACVLEAVQQFTELEALYGGYEVAAREVEALQRPYDALARLINCSPDEVAIVQSATSAWAQVFYGIPFKAGDRVVTAVAEYGSNFIAYLQVCQRIGVVVEVCPELPSGALDLAALEKLLRGSDGQRPAALLALTHVPTSSGRTYDVAAAGGCAQALGVPFLLDACQSVGQMQVDVQQIGCDFLAGTSRKFLRGPRGAGFLYARRAAMAGPAGGPAGWEPALLESHGATWSGRGSYVMAGNARRYEQYEMSFAAKVGLGVAVTYLLDSVGVEAAWQRIRMLANSLRSRLTEEVPRAVVQDKGELLCGIVSFTMLGFSCDTVKSHLAAQHINVSVSRRPSTFLDFESRGLTEVLRASCHYYNSEEEVEQLVVALKALNKG